MIKNPLLEVLLVFGDNIEGIIDIIEAETVEALKKELPVVKGLFLGAGIEDPGKNQESEDPVNTVGDGKAAGFPISEGAKVKLLI